jgi:hypothetical protein
MNMFKNFKMSFVVNNAELMSEMDDARELYGGSLELLSVAEQRTRKRVSSESPTSSTLLQPLFETDRGSRDECPEAVDDDQQPKALSKDGRRRRTLSWKDSIQTPDLIWSCSDDINDSIL